MTNDGPRPRGARVQADGGSRRRRRTVASATAVGAILLLASCNERPLPSPAPASGVDAQAVSGGPFTFENFELGAAPGTVCPGPLGCTNGAAEPAIRADATGTFYVSSELGLSAGTLAWKSTDGGLHYTALESPNQISQAFGGVAPGGGDTDLSTAPDANASGIHNLYVASLSLANVTVSTSQDGGTTWTKTVLSATIPGDDREWIAADQATKVCISYHDIVTFNIDVNCSFDAGATFTQLGSAIDLAHAFLIDDNEIGNLTIDPRNHVIYQVFSGIANLTEAVLPSSFHAVWIAVSSDGGRTFTDHALLDRRRADLDRADPSEPGPVRYGDHAVERGLRPRPAEHRVVRDVVLQRDDGAGQLSRVCGVVRVLRPEPQRRRGREHVHAGRSHPDHPLRWGVRERRGLHRQPGPVRRLRRRRQPHDRPGVHHLQRRSARERREGRPHRHRDPNRRSQDLRGPLSRQRTTERLRDGEPPQALQL